MNFELVSVALEMTDRLLPIRCQDIFVLAAQALMYLAIVSVHSFRVRSAPLSGCRVRRTYVRPRASVQLCRGITL